MLAVTLFTRPGCGLCEEVKTHLTSLAPEIPHQLTEVDIRQDATLLEKYRFIIPVVKIGDDLLAAPITAVQLKLSLEKAAAQTPSAE